MARRVILSLALLALLASSLTGVPASARKQAKAPPAIGFSSAIVVDPVHTFGEPDVRVGLDGVTHVSGPWGTGTQRSIWNMSMDGGRTFHTMHDEALTVADQSVTQHKGPGGGDTEIAIARDGRVFYSDLAALVTLKNAVWKPKARTLETGFVADGTSNANGIDRQWMALWDPANVAATRRASGYRGPFPVNYQTFNAATGSVSCDPPVAGSCSVATYSLDGVTYTEPTVTWPMENDGNPVIDQLSGTVIQAVSTTETSGENYDDIGVALVRRAAGGDPTDPSLARAEIIKISDLPLDDTSAEEGDHMGTRVLFPVTAIDSARNAYVIWANRADGAAGESPSRKAWQISYAWASAASGWKRWSKPIQVSRPPSNTNIMPWAVAGSGGRLAVVWYGTEDTSSNPQEEDIHQAWDVYLAMVERAASARPVIRQTKVTRHPMHYGTICLQGAGCIAIQGNRNLADFFMVEKDPRDGAVLIAYNDTSNEATQNVPPGGPQIQPPIDGLVDHRGAPVVTLMRQNRGIGLFGRPVNGPLATGSSMADVKGDAGWDPIYGGVTVPELDLRGVKVKRAGEELEIRVAVENLDDISQAHFATGGRAVSWVARWTGAPADSPTGVRNPIYYAAAESLLAGQGGGGAGAGVFETTPLFFAGTAQSVELCSVSGCFPHIIEYPRPPLNGVEIAGELVQGAGGAADTLVFHVPLTAIGNPARGSFLESFSVFAFTRNRSAAVPVSNLEGELGITPIVIDGMCCIDVRV